MPTDAPQPQSKRPPVDRSGSSARSQKQNDSDSTSGTTPPTSHAQKRQTSKPHVVGTRLHARVPSYGKSLHKLSKAHPGESHANTKPHRRATSPGTSPGASPMKRVGSEGNLSRNGSATSLKKNHSHVSLKRNRSQVEVKKVKGSGQLKRSHSQPGVNKKTLNRTSVHFDLGNDGTDDGWTEASGSASPNLSRTGSVGGASSGRSSAKPHASADNSRAQSPEDSPTKPQTGTRDWANSRQTDRQIDAHQITSRLLQRTSSLTAAPKMSSISATATPPNNASPESLQRRNSAANGTPQIEKDELVSRFVGSTSGTPGNNASYLQTKSSDPIHDRDFDDARRVKSMGNLARKDSTVDSQVDSDDERALAPRSRKGSTHSYIPPQQSRTQQKLWLQRASSNIEQPAMAPSAALNGLPGLGIHAGVNASPLVGAGYDGRDPRVRLQLERTGLEYLVVRRYQDPVGLALKRLVKLPGNEKMRRIPAKGQVNGATTPSRYGLSQSLKEGKDKSRLKREEGAVSGSGARSSYEGQTDGSAAGSAGGGEVDGEGGLAAILRGLWEKTTEMSPSAE
jgi:hypothetical protein